MNYLLHTPEDNMLENISYYMQQLFFGSWLKGVLSIAAVFFTEVLYGDSAVLYTYVVVTFIDLVLGVFHAHVHHNFQRRFIRHWIYKMVTHLLLVVLIGVVCYSFTRTSGITVSVVNWILFCCTFTELASVLDNLDRLGCPIPPVVNSIMKLVRKRTAQRIMDTIGIEDEACRQELEALLTPATTQRRRSTDRQE